MKFIPILTAIETGYGGRPKKSYFEVRIFDRFGQLGFASVIINHSSEGFYPSYCVFFLPEKTVRYANENSIDIKEKILRVCYEFLNC